MLTAYDDETIRSEAERAEVYCFLVKGRDACRCLIVDMVRRAGRYKPELERRPSSALG